MTRKLTSTALLFSVVCLSPKTSSANDIVDLLRALQGPPAYQQQRYAGHHADSHRQSRLRNQAYQVSSHERHRGHYDHHQDVARSRSRVSFNVQYGNAPILTQAPVPPVPRHSNHHVLPEPPSPGDLGHLPHQLGQVVDCRVPLERHVKVRHTCKVAPGAVPTIIAVRNPHLRRYCSRGCIESLVYVEVLAPPCPPLKSRVSPCRTRIRLDYGKYEIYIVSKNGYVLVNYRD